MSKKYIVFARFPATVIYAAEPLTANDGYTHTFAIEEAKRYNEQAEAINGARERGQNVTAFLHDHDKELSEGLSWEYKEIEE